MTALAALLGLDDDGAGAWREQALCAQVDTDPWFPEKGGSVRDAKRVCAGCPVRVQCLTDALDRNERFGIWGGLTTRERRAAGRGADEYRRLILSGVNPTTARYLSLRRKAG